VIGDILGTPKVSTIDLSNYQDTIGSTIRVVADHPLDMKVAAYDLGRGKILAWNKVFLYA
jgi:hypothetical protein